MSIENVLNSVEKYKENIIQLATFTLNNSETVYGININKVKSFVKVSDIDISINKTEENNFVVGFCMAYGDMYPLVCLENWLKNDFVFNKDLYSVVILTEFNGKLMAFLTKEILKIENKSFSELEKSSTLTNKVSFLTKIEMEEENNEVKYERYKQRLDRRERKRKRRYRNTSSQRLDEKRNKELSKLNELEKIKNIHSHNTNICLVLDIESLLSDASPESNRKLQEEIKTINKKSFSKRVLIAEDSRIAQKILTDILNSIGVDFTIFENGKELIEYYRNNDISNVGLVLTDLEMPVMDGFQVLQCLNELKCKSKIAVNSSMSNNGVSLKAKSLNADYFIEKTQPKEIEQIIIDTCL